MVQIHSSPPDQRISLKNDQQLPADGDAVGICRSFGVPHTTLEPGARRGQRDPAEVTQEANVYHLGLT